MALVVGLGAAAAVVASLTLWRGVELFDEGLMLQAARRVADGQVPYRDFVSLYGPGQPYLLAATFKLFGPSLLGWRVLRALTGAVTSVVVYALLRREAPLGAALAGWAVAALALAQPLTAGSIALALLLALAALLVAGARAGGAWRFAAAGALTALCSLWRLDFGALAAAGVVAMLLLRPGQRGARGRALSVYVAVAAGAGLALWLPFLVAAGPGPVLDQQLGFAGGAYAERAFPLRYTGAFALWPPRGAAEGLKDMLVFYAPLLAVAGLAAAALVGGLRWRDERRAPWRWAGLLALAAGLAGYLLYRPDEPHAIPLVVAVCALLPAGAHWALRHRRAWAGWLAAGTLALLGAYGLANRLAPVVAPPPSAALDLPVADGVRVPLAQARRLERVVAVVQDRVGPGGAVYVATARSDVVPVSNALLYALAERRNPTDRDFVPGDAAGQREVVAALRRARPAVVVRWFDPRGSERLRETRARGGARLLDRYLARAYRPLERDGEYLILVRRGGRGEPAGRPAGAL